VLPNQGPGGWQAVHNQLLASCLQNTPPFNRFLAYLCRSEKAQALAMAGRQGSGGGKWMFRMGGRARFSSASHVCCITEDPYSCSAQTWAAFRH
jgi:hypothetical protein